MSFERAFIHEAVSVDGKKVDYVIMPREDEKALLLWVRERGGVDGRVQECGDGAFGDGGFAQERVSWSER